MLGFLLDGDFNYEALLLSGSADGLCGVIYFLASARFPKVDVNDESKLFTPESRPHRLNLDVTFQIMDPCTQSTDMTRINPDNNYCKDSKVFKMASD